MHGPSRVWLSLGVAAAALLLIDVAIAPCNPHASINSFDSTREMRQPYRGVWLLLNLAAPVLLGVGAGLAFRRAHRTAGFATWLVSGFLLYYVSVVIWRSVCPA